jgi:hypothetical protein
MDEGDDEHDGDSTIHKHDVKPIANINWREAKRVRRSPGCEMGTAESTET